jgi:O-antigen ligase
MILSTSSTVNRFPRWTQLLVLVLAACGLSVALATWGSGGLQVAVAGAGVIAAISVMAFRVSSTLNPAWIPIGVLYLIGPVGVVVASFSTGIPAVGIMVAIFGAFVGAALVKVPRARTGLELMWPLGALLALAGLSLLWSSDQSYGISKVVLWAMAALLPTVFVVVLTRATNCVSWGLIVAVALVIACATIAFGSAAPEYPGRPTLFGANPIWAARAAYLGALVALFGPFRRVVRIALPPLMIVAGVLTLSVGPAVGFAAGGVAGALERMRTLPQSDRRVALGWVLLVLAAIIVAAAYGYGLFDSAIGMVGGIIGEGNVTSRSAYLEVSGSLFAGAPLLGIGAGGFAATGLDTYPHNLIVEIAVELGVAGLLLFLVWLGLALYGAIGSPLLVALVVGTFVFSLFSGNLPGNAEFWLSTGFAVAKIPEKRATVTERHLFPRSHGGGND